MNSPVITLQNGVRIANFSSPHSFVFDDGSILPACSAMRANMLKLKDREEEIKHPSLPIVDIKVTFHMVEEVQKALQELQAREDVDIILVPLFVSTAMKEIGLVMSKVRGCRVKDRVSKILFSDKFCIQ